MLFRHIKSNDCLQRGLFSPVCLYTSPGSVVLIGYSLLSIIMSIFVLHCNIIKSEIRLMSQSGWLCQERVIYAVYFTSTIICCYIFRLAIWNTRRMKYWYCAVYGVWQWYDTLCSLRCMTMIALHSQLLVIILPHTIRITMWIAGRRLHIKLLAGIFSRVCT